MDDQRIAIERFAQDRGLAVLRWYVDDAISGTDASSRRAFREMTADASSPARLFSTVLVYDIKRFGRVDNDESRDLSKVTIRRMISRIRRGAERGFWLVGFPRTATTSGTIAPRSGSGATGRSRCRAMEARTSKG